MESVLSCSTRTSVCENTQHITHSTHSTHSTHNTLVWIAPLKKEEKEEKIVFAVFCSVQKQFQELAMAMNLQPEELRSRLDKLKQALSNKENAGNLNKVLLNTLLVADKGEVTPKDSQVASSSGGSSASDSFNEPKYSQVLPVTLSRVTPPVLLVRSFSLSSWTIQLKKKQETKTSRKKEEYYGLRLASRFLSYL